MHKKNISYHVQSFDVMIHMFLLATNFYGKRAIIEWQHEPAYIDKSMTDPLEYVLVKNSPQQDLQSKYVIIISL